MHRKSSQRTGPKPVERDGTRAGEREENQEHRVNVWLLELSPSREGLCVGGPGGPGVLEGGDNWLGAAQVLRV